MWNKRPKPCQSFKKVCQQSLHFIISRACLFDACGHRTNHSTGPSTGEDVACLMLLLDKRGLWPLSSTMKHSLDVKFWWDSVRPRVKVGPSKGRSKEGTTEDKHVEHLFDLMCLNEEEHKFDNVEACLLSVAPWEVS